MTEQRVTQTTNQWQERIAELQSLLDEVKPLLVAAETELSEQLAAINAFEFNVRSRLEQLTRRLETLTDEIQNLRRQLNHLREDLHQEDEFHTSSLYERWRDTEEAGSAASGNYRYREAPERGPITSLSPDQSTAIKRLYRQLARRFHPDFALDEEDRRYRTGMMMAINAAYVAGDMERLEVLAQEPDPQQKSYSDQELAEVLLKEWHRCRRRIKEIEAELDRLEEHPSMHLLRLAEKAAAEDRDLLDELAGELRDKIAYKLVQRDMLLDEIESFGKDNLNLGNEEFADAVYDLGLEEVLVEDPISAFVEWRDKHRDRLDFEEGSEEDAWEELLKKRNRDRR
ncbi:MAG: hypothetical protein R3293_01395 [Candidatus Promineifilaceae bacterium]|nr:hypothetical protein [Candidatus Promineifilaceae bacterium]